MKVGLLIKDARDYIATIRRRDWVFGSLSVMMTVIIMWAFLNEHRWGYLKPDPIIAYFKSWEDGRSRADALAAQAEEERLLREQAEAIAAELDIAAPEGAAPEVAAPEGEAGQPTDPADAAAAPDDTEDVPEAEPVAAPEVPAAVAE